MDSRSTNFFSNDDHRLTLDVFTARSNLRPHALYGKNVEKSFPQNVLEING